MPSASRSIRCSRHPSHGDRAAGRGGLDQHLTVGSGIVDPIRAIEKGAPIAIWRVDMQSPPYALLAKPAIKSIKELKGKTISIGGAKDITRIFVERMLVPNGVKPGDVDYVFAGATSARLSALQSGAVDAAILTSPHNFYAEAAGFTNLGWTIEYAKELPFSGGAVNAPGRRPTSPCSTKFIARLQQERELVSGSQQPRRGGEDHDGGRPPEAGGRREEPTTSCKRANSSS